RLWRRFLQWMGHQFELLLHPAYLDLPQGAAFLKDLRRALAGRFQARSFLYDDEAIRGRAVARLTAHFDSRRELKQIARLATDIFWKGSTAPLPSWRLA